MVSALRVSAISGRLIKVSAMASLSLDLVCGDSAARVSAHAPANNNIVHDRFLIVNQTWLFCATILLKINTWSSSLVASITSSLVFPQKPLTSTLLHNPIISSHPLACFYLYRISLINNELADAPGFVRNAR